MENSLIQQFTNTIFGNVKVLMDNNGEPWFIGNEIAAILGYSRPRDAVHDHVYDEDKGSAKLTLPQGGTQETIIINESGLYSLILRSKMPAARQFQHWVTSEVLPTMRQIGFDKSINILKQEIDRLNGINAKLTKENYELNTAYNGLQQSFTNQSVDFAFNTDARNQIIEKIMSVSWLTPEQKQYLIKYEGE